MGHVVEVLGIEDLAEIGLCDPTNSLPISKWSIESIPSVWSLNGEISWLVPDLLAEGAVTLLTGDSGVGKSTFALALCGSVVRGELFLKRQTVCRKVLYVDKENSLGIVRERLDRLGIEETPDLIVWGQWIDRAVEGPGSKAILEFAKLHRPLIVFDSYVAFHQGSEQDAVETRRHMQLYRNLAALGASVLVVHHTGKGESSKQYRGSSDIKAAVDSAWLLESLSDSSQEIRSLRLTPFKARITPSEPIRLEYDSGRFDSSSDPVSLERERLEAIITANPEIGKTDLVKIACGSGIAKHSAEKLLQQGEAQGWLEIVTGARGKKSYRLSQDVDQASFPVSQPLG